MYLLCNINFISGCLELLTIGFDDSFTSSFETRGRIKSLILRIVVRLFESSYSIDICKDSSDGLRQAIIASLTNRRNIPLCKTTIELSMVESPMIPGCAL